jgi:hypothetical protein
LVEVRAPAQQVGQYGTIGGKGFVYADYRGGLQMVQTDFARSVGVAHKNFGPGSTDHASQEVAEYCRKAD